MSLEKQKVNPNIFFGILDLVKLFKEKLGYKIYLVYLAAVVAGVADGISIVMVVPFFSVILGEKVSLLGSGGVLDYFYKLLNDISSAYSQAHLLLFITLIFVLKGILSFSMAGYSVLLRARLLENLKKQSIQYFSRMSYAYFSTKSVGYFSNIINDQVNKILQCFHFSTQIGANILNAIIYQVLALLVAFKFGIMTMVLSLLLILPFQVLNKKIRNISVRNAVENGYFAKLVIQYLRSFKYLKATNQGDKMMPSLNLSIKNLASFDTKMGLGYSFTNAVREPLLLIGVFIIIFIQLHFFSQSIGPIIASLMLFYRALNSVMNVQVNWQKVLESVGSFEIVLEEFESIDRKHSFITTNKYPFQLNKSLVLHNIRFNYETRANHVLNNITLVVNEKTTIALVGGSGSGKTTIVDILSFLLSPNSGIIQIDGREIKNHENGTWGNNLGYVTQEAVLFDDTIANNICMWDQIQESSKYDFNRIKNAAKVAHIDDFIESLELGYETQIGDEGVFLSGGQKQRLILARELYREPQLLVLDEATSALDSESEYKIQQSIDELKGKMTIIIIAHRLSTVRNVDKIHVLKNGIILESGSFSDLIENTESEFSKMVKTQMM